MATEEEGDGGESAEKGEKGNRREVSRPVLNGSPLGPAHRSDVEGNQRGGEPSEDVKILFVAEDEGAVGGGSKDAEEEGGFAGPIHFGGSEELGIILTGPESC